VFVGAAAAVVFVGAAAAGAVVFVGAATGVSVAVAPPQAVVSSARSSNTIWLTELFE
jgi:hypothetical protein